MSKYLCWAAFLLFACALGAQAGPAAAPDAGLDSFLTSLQTPEPLFKEEMDGSCYVSVNCDVGGYSVSCSSPSGDCHANGNSVTCDGVQYQCPVCRARTTCICYGYQIECFGWQSCDVGFDEVTCDGGTETCSPPWDRCPV